MLVKTKQRIAQPPPIPLELARRFALLSKEEKRAFILRASQSKSLRIKYTWAAWAREKQLWQLEAPWSWDTWFLCAGRGFGKTRTGAQQIIEWAAADHEALIALVGRTVADVRDVMVGGKSGILACSPPWFKPEYKPSQRKLIWPNGALAYTYTAEKPDQLRGPQHSKAWGDERAAWQYDDAWDQLQFGLRLGAKPQCVVTSTPRATKAVKELLREPGTHFTRGNTYENTANLARKFIQQIERKYGGTRLGRQEIDAEILDDNPGALWKRETMIERYRVARDQVPPLKRVVVAVDPAVKAPDPAKAARGELDESVAETGIVVAGLGLDDQGYVLADYSMQGMPLEWANQGIVAFDSWKADAIVGEVNNGGDLVESNFRTVRKNISYQAVRATRGKLLRAEPVSNLYQQGRVHHVGTFSDLEDQQCNWIPGDRSPDRLDALVWAFFALMIQEEEDSGILLATATDEDVALFGNPEMDLLSAWSSAQEMEW
jgi:phage terminase large subunit-like protein